MLHRRIEGRPDWATKLLEGRQALRLTGKLMAGRLDVPESTYRHAELGNAGTAFFNDRTLARLRETIGIKDTDEIFQGWSRAKNSDTSGSGSEVLLLPPVLQRGLIEARVTRFHPSRRSYQDNREGRGTIADYISQASQCVEMVSINLATGHDQEMLRSKFEELIARRNPPVTVRISLLDPALDYLAASISPVLNMAPETLRARVSDTIQTLEKLHKRDLARSRREYLEVWCHNCMPNGSAIIIDGDASSGLFQLESKGFQTGMDESFGFEVGAGSEFFRSLRDSYRNLISSGRRVI